MSELIEAHQPCPDCGSSDALSRYSDGHTFCFSCEKYIPPEHEPGLVVKEFTFTYEYLPWRGITKDTMQFFGVKTKIDSSGKPISLGYRYSNNSYKIRDLTKKAFHSVGDINKAGLFGRNLFDPGAYKTVTITEGEADALACWQILRSPCCSVQSSVTGSRDCTLDHSWLQSFDRIYLALDGDSQGKRATADIAKLFDRSKLYHVRLNRHKDPLGYLQAGEQSEFLSIWENSKNYLPEHTISSLSDFQSVLDKTPQPGIPYPFRQLQEMTYGIRTGETTLITAFEGVGKTECLHALEYSILRGCDRNIGAIFLEETTRRHLESLAGIHLQRPAHLPDSGCTVDEIKTAVREVLGKDDRLFLDTRFGSCNVHDLIAQIRFLVSGCNCSVVMLDHVSMALGGSEGEDERKNLDLFFTEMETMVKELDFAFIVVSHVNDYGQTRGSRWGGKVADIRIDLSRAIGSNIMRIDVAKNRFGGKAGFAGNYEFDPITRQYKEAANDNQTILGEMAA